MAREADDHCGGQRAYGRAISLDRNSGVELVDEALHLSTQQEYCPDSLDALKRYLAQIKTPN